MLKEKSKTKLLNKNPYEDRIGLVYARVSSKKQEIEGSGLDSQEGRCINDLRSIKVSYKKSFRDSFTGGGDFMNRPAMRELLTYADAHPREKYLVVFDDLSRLARDVEFHLKLRAAFKVRDIMVRCLNFNFDESPEGRYTETIIAAGSELERHKNRRQVIQKMSARLEAGYWPFSRKRGYDMVRDRLHGKFARPNDKGLKILKPALEAFANGELIHKIDFCRHLLEKGFWPGKVAEKYLDQATGILTDYFFMGDVGYEPWDIARRQGHHQGIISAATYEKIQMRLKRKISTVRVRKDITDEFPVRGLVNCVCKAHMTASWSKGRSNKYGYYFCTARGCALYRKSVPQNLVEKEFVDILKKTRLKDEVGKVINVIFDRVWKEEVATLERREITLMQSVRELNDKITGLTDLARKAKNEYLRGVYEKQIEQTAIELEYEQSKSVQDTDLMIPYRTALDKAKALLKSPYVVWKKMEIEEQHDLFFFIFDEKLIYDAKDGYRTADIPSAARMFEEFVSSNSVYVDPTGLEPATPSLQMRCSTR